MISIGIKQNNGHVSWTLQIQTPENQTDVSRTGKVVLIQFLQKIMVKADGDFNV